MRITFALLLVAAGCSTRRTISRTPFESEVARINADASDREVKIIDTAGREVAATRLSLDLENATWHDAAGQPKMVPIEALRQISHLSPGHPRAMGALQGLGLGLLVGAATGAVIGLASGDDRCSNDWCIFRLTAAQKAVGGGILLGGVGLILGTAIGAIVGAHTTIVFR